MGDTPDDSKPDADSIFERVNTMYQYMTKARPDHFDAHICTNLKLVSASISPSSPNIGLTTFELLVPRQLCNSGGNLHGGAVATIFDICTSLAVSAVAREDFWDEGHVSRTINTTYLRPAPEGTVLLVESEVVHLGRSMGLIKGVMRRKGDGAVCYTCEHGKANLGAAGSKL